MNGWITLALAAFLLAAPPSLGAREPAEAVTLIKGLDGGTYEPYGPETIEKVQQALKAAGLFQREVTGILDEETMKAVGEFQRSNQLTVSGVPSPATRKLLLKRE